MNETGSRNPAKNPFRATIQRASGTRRVAVIAVAVVALALLGAFVFKGSGGGTSEASAYVVTRGELLISVLERGSLKALNSQEIRSEVEGQTTIISIIPEGTVITEDDIAKKRVLVELDASDLKDRLTQQDITFQGATAGNTQAKASYDIQVNQNESDINGGKLKVKFAQMDLEKYLGVELSGVCVDRKDKDEDNDFLAMADDPRLGGKATQERDKLTSNIKLAWAEVDTAKSRLQGTEKLRTNEYVTETELASDQLKLEYREIELQQAELALKLFKRYEFPKEAEQLLSDYRESLRELERIKARTGSELAQKDADLKSKEATYKLQKEKLEKYRRQLEACVIRATRPGLVVYSSSQQSFGRSSNLIEEGATVRERQSIIILPDTSAMAVEVSVHETSVDKVKPGQEALITVDAFPDKPLRGHVYRVAPLPDAQSRWMNPDIKVYQTDVVIDGNADFVRPGMSAEVEIIVARLNDVLSVPIQSVYARQGRRVCYVAGSKVETRLVKTGMENDKFVEITGGLAAGEKVLMRPPDVLPPLVLTDEEATASAAAAPASAGVVDGHTAEPPVAENATGAAEQPEGTEQDRARMEQMRERFENMSEEERAKLREQFQNTTPENRGPRRSRGGSTEDTAP